MPSALASASKELPREIVSRIPKMNSLKRTIQRIRKKFPVLRPNCVEELKIPDLYQITEKKNKCLNFDTEIENIRVLVYSIGENSKILKKRSQ